MDGPSGITGHARSWSRWVAAPLQWLLGLVLLFEEWGWEPLQRMLGWVARLPVLRRAEDRIMRLPPYPALAVFLLLAVPLLAVKIGAWWLIANGKGLLGLLLVIVAKLVGTAVAARLFTLTRPALLGLDWFAVLYARWTAWKNALLARIRASWAWRTARRWRLRMRHRWMLLRTKWID
jgi:hypothetical protein